MDLLSSKICAAVTLTFGTIFVGVLPAWFSLYGRRNWPLFISCLLCFGGGVLLATSLVHMLPEVRLNFIEYAGYTEVLFCAGFLLLYFLDEVVHYFFGEAHAINNINHSHSHHGHQQTRGTPQSSGYGSIDTVPLIHHNQPAYNPYIHRACEQGDAAEERPSQLCHIGHDVPCNNSSVGSLGLLMALSVHAILEGLAVGLEESPSKVLLLFGAISSHKLVVGFCLGVELSSSARHSQLRHFFSILVFSLGSPLGVVIGMSMANIPKNVVDIMLPILQSLAGGTLLYVSVSEVLPRERARWHKDHQKKHAGILQYICVLAGFTLMTILAKYMDFD